VTRQLYAPDQTEERADKRSLPTCTCGGWQQPCWYCALPSWMFDKETARLKKPYHGYATPWSKPRRWLTNVSNVRHEGIRDALQSEAWKYVYCGRGNARSNLPESMWHNPFHIDIDGTRDEVICKFEEYLTGNKDLMKMLPLLRGKILVCWCYPESCHCDVLAHWANQHWRE
jgi:hypothetical protein